MWPVHFEKHHANFPSTGVKKGDRISIYMPMILELVVAMLACARIGALHSIVVGISPLHCSWCWGLWVEQLLLLGEELERWVLTMRWMETKLRCCCFVALFCINCGMSSFNSPSMPGGIVYHGWIAQLPLGFLAWVFFFAYLLTWLCNLCQFAGFSADSLCERILDCGCSLLITAGKTCICAPVLVSAPEPLLLPVWRIFILKARCTWKWKRKEQCFSWAAARRMHCL